MIDLFIIIFTNAIRTYADDFTTALHMALLREWHKIAIVTKALFRWLRTGWAGESLEDFSPDPNCVTIIITIFWALTKFAPKFKNIFLSNCWRSFKSGQLTRKIVSIELDVIILDWFTKEDGQADIARG